MNDTQLEADHPLIQHHSKVLSLLKIPQEQVVLLVILARLD